MTEEENIIWEKIKKFKVDPRDSLLTFQDRLARENGWSYEFTERAVNEYKRFIFLCVVSDIPVTPSDVVDQVWHLHLVYTQSYWNCLCKEILGIPINHNPTKGGITERHKYRNQYTDTLIAYKTKYQELPPTDIWPNTDKRFSDIESFQRVNMATHEIYPKKLVQLISASLFTFSILAMVIFLATNSLVLVGIFSIFSLFSGMALVNSINTPISEFVIFSNWSTSESNDKDNKKSNTGCGAGCGGCGGCGG